MAGKDAAASQYRYAAGTYMLCLALASALLLSACGAGRAYKSNTQSWLGAPIEEVIARWGEPAVVNTASNGQKEYVWSNATTPIWHEPAPYIPPAQDTGEDDFEYFKRRAEYDHNYRGDGYYSSIGCLTFVTVDSAGRVEEIKPESFLGLSNCRFVDPPPARE